MSINFEHWLEEQTRPRTLLLVDDSAEDAELIVKHTASYHCRWVLASTLAEAAACLRDPAAPPTLIFLDMKLGSTALGIEAYKQLKSSFHVPIVMLSGHYTTETVAELNKLGCSLLAVKPACFNEAYFANLFATINVPERPQGVLAQTHKSSSYATDKY